MPTIPYSYEADGTLSAAGDMVLSRAQNTGLLIGTSLGNIASSISYNAYGETDMETYSKSDGSLIDFDYSANNVSRDGLGRILQKSETYDGVTTRYAYTYDHADRLTDVYVYKDNSPHPSEHHAYEYDNGALPVGNGNRTKYIRRVDNDQDGTWDETEPVDGTYDLQDRLLTYGDATYTYTDGGMLASKADGDDLTAYSYDLMGSLKTVSLPDGREISYMVDGLGRRIWKKEDGVLTKGYIYADALNPIAALNGDGEVESVFVYGSKINVPDYILKRTDDSWETYRIISDQVGSVRLVVRTSDETVVQELEYDPFGQITQDTSPGFQPFSFAGGLYDTDTRLIRFGARYYDPETGRWTAKDPIRFKGGDTNLYGYVLNDPVNWIDQNGLSKDTDWGCVVKECLEPANIPAEGTLITACKMTKHWAPCLGAAVFAGIAIFNCIAECTDDKPDPPPDYPPDDPDDDICEQEEGGF